MTGNLRLRGFCFHILLWLSPLEEKKPVPQGSCCDLLWMWFTWHKGSRNVMQPRSRRRPLRVKLSQLQSRYGTSGTNRHKYACGGRSQPNRLRMDPTINHAPVQPWQRPDLVLYYWPGVTLKWCQKGRLEARRGNKASLHLESTTPMYRYLGAGWTGWTAVTGRASHGWYCERKELYGDTFALTSPFIHFRLYDFRSATIKR